jgi:2-polyprenyl-6-methoxyphenol hydroxylase-like FAD-dependent oxidoreductase
VTTSSGEILHAPLVLACDGIRSVARPAMGNPRPRFTGRTSWRAVLDGASQLVSGACLTTGQGKQFIASSLEGNLVYWAADVGLPEGVNEAMVGRKEFLLRNFSQWHDPICELIERTDEDELVIADVFDSVPRHLFRDRIVALGDAAHPMTPDLGQGACQAIEDAVVLAACLSKGRDVSSALAEYEAVRLRRVRMVVRASRRLGRIATTESEIVSRVRDGLASHMPDWLNRMLVGRYASTASFLKTLPQDA